MTVDSCTCRFPVKSDVVISKLRYVKNESLYMLLYVLIFQTHAFSLSGIYAQHKSYGERVSEYLGLNVVINNFLVI